MCANLPVQWTFNCFTHMCLGGFLSSFIHVVVSFNSNINIGILRTGILLNSLNIYVQDYVQTLFFT